MPGEQSVATGVGRAMVDLHRKSTQNVCVVASNPIALQFPDALDGKKCGSCWRPEEESARDLMISTVTQSLFGRLAQFF